MFWNRKWMFSLCYYSFNFWSIDYPCPNLVIKRFGAGPVSKILMVLSSPTSHGWYICAYLWTYLTWMLNLSHGAGGGQACFFKHVDFFLEQVHFVGHICNNLHYLHQTWIDYASFDTEVNTYNGPYVFKVHGWFYYVNGSQI